MRPTVRELLALPVLADGRPRVVCGDGLDRPVRWVHISEATDLTDLLTGDELVLSTGFPLVGEPTAVRAYLDMLAVQRVAGLVVELGTHVKAVPEWLPGYASAYPIVVLRERIRFVDVTQEVHRRIVADQYEAVEFARQTHEVFTSLNIAGATPTDIVAQAARILGVPVVLEDTGRQVLAYAAADEPAATLLRRWAERSRLADPTWTVVPVGVGGDTWGRLVLPRPASNRAQTVLERAAQALQLHRMLQQEQDALVVLAWGGLLDDLRAGHAGEADALARSSALGLAPGPRYLPLVLAAPRHADPIVQGATDRYLLTALRQAAHATGRTVIASVRKAGTVSAIIACRDPEAAIRETRTALADRLGRRPTTAGWVAGTAEPTRELTAAGRDLAEAEHVATVGLTMPERGHVYRASDVRLRGLLHLLRDDHRVQAFAEVELRPLLLHDAQHGDDLVGLLRAYLDASGSKTETARVTGLSRPTLYSRLRTVERLLRVPLDDGQSRTSLHAALMILDTRP